MLDSDTVWAPDALREMLRPFADPRVGGVTPRQAIFDVGDNPVRRLADWIEDIRYHLTVPAQSVFGQVGCLAGRTIAYRRTAFEPAVERLVRQTVLGVPQHVGDDRVLTNELLRDRLADRLPVDRAGRDRRAVGLADVLAPAAALGPLEPARDAAQPALAVAQAGRVRVASRPTSSRRSRSTPSSALARRARARAGTAAPTGAAARGRAAARLPRDARQHRRAPDPRTCGGAPRDIARLPLFVLQITFVMVPIRIAAFATMFHQGWGSRSDRPALSRVRDSLLRPEPAQETVTVMSGETTP